MLRPTIDPLLLGLGDRLYDFLDNRWATVVRIEDSLVELSTGEWVYRACRHNDPAQVINVDPTSSSCYHLQQRGDAV